MIEYHGTSSTTASCVSAITRIAYAGDLIGDVKLLSYDRKHAFLLTINEYQIIAIRPGFTSGYHGEGPRGLATVLQILKIYTDSIEEYPVDPSILKKIDKCSLTQEDINNLERTEPIRPAKWADYIYDVKELHESEHHVLRKQYALRLPLNIIDPRIMDLAINFESDPDKSILSGYRRLEDIIRERTGLSDQNNTKLFSIAFYKDDPPLIWKDISASENKGRAQLFSAVFMAFRNKRAHKEITDSIEDSIREFLMLNQLFQLESVAQSN